MSDYTFHTETYEHKNGKKYIVEVVTDYDFGPPDDENDCHGVVVELDFDPHDEGAVDDWVYENLEEDSPRELEERARLSMMQELGRFGRGRSYKSTKYYDVWASLKKAKKDWGCKTDEEAQAAVDNDFAYLDGWYCDDWHWACVWVYATDEDGEKDEEYCHCIGGYESTIIDAENRSWFDEVIEDCIHQVEHDIRKELHQDQLELEL